MLTSLREALARVLALFRRDQLDREFHQEMELHVALLTDENIRRGMTPDAARRAAVARLGPASLPEQHRDARGLPGVEAILLDLRFALRLLAKERWFSAAAIAALALGIGANATGFTIINAVFLRGLPFEDADRLYVVSWQNRAGRRANTSYVELHDWRTESRTFAGLAGFRYDILNISDDTAMPEQVDGTWLTADAFALLRQPPLLGRTFVSLDERPGADRVVIIGDTLWQRRYGRDPNVLGKTVRVNGEPATIIGVMPEGMQFPDQAELWGPIIPSDAERQRSARTLRVFGRLHDDVDRREAQAELSGIAQQLIAAYPDATKDLVGARVETFTERYIGGIGRPMFYTVMGAVSLVLLIACANVANLLLSRSAYRAREIAVRSALGATRGRVVRQLLLESLVLGFAGGSIGLVLAAAGVQAFASAMQGTLPYWIAFTVDYAVFGYVAVICVLTAMLFGLAPALHVSKSNANDVLKEGGRGQTGGQRVRRFSHAMVVAELALTIVLLVAAGLTVRSFAALYSADLGIDINGLMTMTVRLPESRYPTAEARRAFFDRLEPRLAGIAGVEAAAVTNGVPPLDGGERLLETERTVQSPGTRPVFVGTVTITPRFFDVVGVRLLGGRAFDGRDGAPGLETVIINERLATQFFPGEDPIGKRLRFTVREPVPGKAPDVWRTIVGVTPLIKHGSNSDFYINSVVYIPYRQESPASASLLVRSVLPAGSVMDAVGREVQTIDPDQPVLSIQTVAQLLEQDRWWYRTWGSLFAILAAIALTLSSIGLYGVMAYAVSQRTQEIGVRVALGADRRRVSWLILGRALRQIALGLAIGFAIALPLALGRVMPGGLADMTPFDPVAIVGITALLTTVSIVACLVPIRRAMRVDPVVALRAE
jgi:putative ABC transport system permease protein